VPCWSSVGAHDGRVDRAAQVSSKTWRSINWLLPTELKARARPSTLLVASFAFVTPPEATEAHGIAEDEVDQLEHDELAAGRDDPQRHRGDELRAPRIGGPEPAENVALEEDHHLQGKLEQRRPQQREGEAFADDRGAYAIARLRTTT
jgi:hypothetical protein